MLDVALLFGRLVLLALLYVFLFAAVRAGLGMVSRASAQPTPAGLGLAVVSGPEELVGVRVPLTQSVTIGRAPDADLIVSDEFISSHHARVSAVQGTFVAEDLGSTNGTLLNGRALARPTRVKAGDLLEIGTVRLRVERT